MSLARELSTAGFAPRPGEPRLRAARLPDSRADHAAREVELLPETIRIARTVRSVAMKLSVPSEEFDGVVLRLAQGDGLRFFYEVTLVHRDPDLCVPLLSVEDQMEGEREWRAWSRFFDLPALVEREPGLYVDPDFRLPELPGPRRRGRLLTERRGAFALRRKQGHAARMTTRFSSERVIIAYE